MPCKHHRKDFLHGVLLYSGKQAIITKSEPEPILFRIQPITFRSISLFEMENGQTPTHIFSQCL